MTRIQALGILTGMLTTVEAAGLTTHHSLDLGSVSARLVIFIYDEEATISKIKKLLKEMVPDGMSIETSHITETSANCIEYEIDF